MSCIITNSIISAHRNLRSQPWWHHNDLIRTPSDCLTNAGPKMFQLASVGLHLPPQGPGPAQGLRGFFLWTLVWVNDVSGDSILSSESELQRETKVKNGYIVIVTPTLWSKVTSVKKEIIILILTSESSDANYKSKSRIYLYFFFQ